MKQILAALIAVTAMSSFSSAQTVAELPRPRDTDSINLAPAGQNTIVVQARRRNGTVLPCAQVWLYRNGHFCGYAVANHKGRTVFGGLPRGTYVAIVRNQNTGRTGSGSAYVCHGQRRWIQAKVR